jgi:hypothetical protein
MKSLLPVLILQISFQTTYAMDKMTEVENLQPAELNEAITQGLNPDLALKKLLDPVFESRFMSSYEVLLQKINESSLTLLLEKLRERKRILDREAQRLNAGFTRTGLSVAENALACYRELEEERKVFIMAHAYRPGIFCVFTQYNPDGTANDNIQVRQEIQNVDTFIRTAESILAALSKH